jgi:formate C-acetyltransferase
MYGCLEHGVDLLGGLPYTSINVRDAGFANTVNSLASIARVVHEERLATPVALAAALRADYAGHEPLRRALCGAATRGNDDSATDRWALAWLEVRDRACRRVEQVLGIPRLLPELVTRSLHHLEGARLAATPAGRRAGDPLGDSVGAVLGGARRGPTALMTSVCGMNAALHWPGGYNLNVTLPSARWSQPSTLGELVALIDGFFGSGGQELQLAVLDADTLREARAHPDRHPDLIVRVAGFNARFGELSTVEQDELIARAEAVG